MMSVLLIPMWLLSGALFPSGGASSILAAIMRANPMTYSVEAIRRALYGSAGLPGTLGLEGSSLGLELGVLTGFAAVALGLAILLCSRRA